MKPHPRPPVPRGAAPALRRAVRKTIKWGGLALCLLLAGVWVRSEWGFDDFAAGGWSLQINRGLIVVNAYTPASEGTGWTRSTPAGGFPRQWRWTSGRTVYKSLGNQAVDYWVLPMWMPLAPTLLATAAAWRLDAVARRRARAGRCPKCGYDRAGLAASAVCPECGSLPAEPAPHA